LIGVEHTATQYGRGRSFPLPQGANGTGGRANADRSTLWLGGVAGILTWQCRRLIGGCRCRWVCRRLVLGAAKRPLVGAQAHDGDAHMKVDCAGNRKKRRTVIYPRSKVQTEAQEFRDNLDLLGSILATYESVAVTYSKVLLSPDRDEEDARGNRSS
jgi:hypothetical protein